MGGINRLPNREQLNEILTYDPYSGKFTWRVSRGKVRSGQPAGSANSQGYILIKINGKTSEHTESLSSWFMANSRELLIILMVIF